MKKVWQLSFAKAIRMSFENVIIKKIAAKEMCVYLIFHLNYILYIIIINFQFLLNFFLNQIYVIIYYTCGSKVFVEFKYFEV